MQPTQFVKHGELYLTVCVCVCRCPKDPTLPKGHSWQQKTTDGVVCRTASFLMTERMPRHSHMATTPWPTNDNCLPPRETVKAKKRFGTKKRHSLYTESAREGACHGNNMVIWRRHRGQQTTAVSHTRKRQGQKAIWGQEKGRSVYAECVRECMPWHNIVIWRRHRGQQTTAVSHHTKPSRPKSD